MKLSHYDAVLRDQLFVQALNIAWNNQLIQTEVQKKATSDEHALFLTHEAAWNIAVSMMDVRAVKIEKEKSQ